MTPTMYPVVTASSQGINPGNDSRHNRKDANKGGGPQISNRKMVPPAKRGGFGHQGQRTHVQAKMPSGRGGTGNPASRGGTPKSFHPERRNPNQGGGVQMKDTMDTVSGRGGFGHSGQQGVPGVRTNPQPGAGNASGKMAKRVAGHFTNKTKGQGGNTGKYGGPPVRLDN